VRAAGAVDMKWPSTDAEHAALARDLIELVAGRRDVVAKWFDFEGDDGRRVTGWGPWKGRKVAADYVPADGERVQSFANRKGPGIVHHAMRALDADALTQHLRRRVRLGVYVLDDDSRCSF